MHTRSLRAAAIAFAATSSNASAGQIEDVVLYDMDFEAPYQTAGSLVRTDRSAAPRSGPSRVSFGTPMIATDPRSASDQVLRFEGRTLQQISLDVGQPLYGTSHRPADEYVLKFDMDYGSSEEELNGGFVVLFDSPRVTNLVFRPNETIWVQTGNPSTDWSPVGAFDRDEPVTVAAYFRPSERTATFFVNGLLVFEGLTRADPTQDLRSVRLSTKTGVTNVMDVAIDNLSLTARYNVVPAPGTALLLGTLGLVARRRHR